MIDTEFLLHFTIGGFVGWAVTGGFALCKLREYERRLAEARELGDQLIEARESQCTWKGLAFQFRDTLRDERKRLDWIIAGLANGYQLDKWDRDNIDDAIDAEEREDMQREKAEDEVREEAFSG